MKRSQVAGRVRPRGGWLPHGLVLGAAVSLALLFGPDRVAGAAGPSGARLSAAGAPRASGQLPAAAGPSISMVYLRDCATCHAADASGTNRGPSLAGVGRAAIDYWVSTGRMPLYGDAGRPAKTAVQQPKPGEQLGSSYADPSRRPAVYSPQIIQQLTDYVAGLSGGSGLDIPHLDLAHADVATGGQLFRQQCAACHAWDGDGGALLHREAPGVHQATPVQIAEAIRTGPANMPAFGTASISDRDLGSVVAYVHYLDHPEDRGGEPFWHLGPVAEGAVVWVVGIGLVVLALRWIGERS